MSKKARIFNSESDYEEVCCPEWENCEGYNRVNVIDIPRKIDIEVKFEMKRMKCAVKRFFRELPEKYERLKCFEEEMLDAIEDIRFSKQIGVYKDGAFHSEWGLNGECGEENWAVWDIEPNGWDDEGAVIYISLRVGRFAFEIE